MQVELDFSIALWAMGLIALGFIFGSYSEKHRKPKERNYNESDH